MLDQDAHEALEAAEYGSMDHDGPVLASILSDIREIKPLRHDEVELNRAALPRPPEAILKWKSIFDRRRPHALIDPVVEPADLESAPQCVSGEVPDVVRADRSRASCSVPSVWEAECPVEAVDQVDHSDNLVLHLVSSHVNVSVVLGEGAHAEEPVQSA